MGGQVFLYISVSLRKLESFCMKRGYVLIGSGEYWWEHMCCKEVVEKRSANM